MSLTLSASLFASAWAAFLLGPVLVGRRRWAVRNPTLALHAWALLFVAVLAAIYCITTYMQLAMTIIHADGFKQLEKSLRWMDGKEA